jgi:hypothetical protein
MTSPHHPSSFRRGLEELRRTANEYNENEGAAQVQRNLDTEAEIRAISNVIQNAIRQMTGSWDRAMMAVEQAANRWEEKAGEV